MAFLYLISVLSLVVLAVPLQNITITAPEGTSNHGDPRLLCTPMTGTKIATFFFGNYFAHVATVLLLPGEATVPAFLAMAAALLYPVSGLHRGIEAIRKCAMRPKSTSLETALRAGALCEVVRLPDWHPEKDDIHTVPKESQDQDEETPRDTRGTNDRDALEEEIPEIQQDEDKEFGVRLNIQQISADCFLPTKFLFSSSGRRVHGHCSLPPGYALAILPPSANVRNLTEISNSTESSHISELLECLGKFLERLKDNSKNGFEASGERSPAQNQPVLRSNELCSTYAILRVAVSIFQLVFAGFTLYSTRGDQLERYGYAAFGLTATPYLMMSIINLFGSLLTPSYPYVYLVQTSIMEEARRRKDAAFDGAVGKITSPYPPQSTHQRFKTSDEPIGGPYLEGSRETINRLMSKISRFDEVTERLSFIAFWGRYRKAYSSLSDMVQQRPTETPKLTRRLVPTTNSEILRKIDAALVDSVYRVLTAIQHCLYILIDQASVGYTKGNHSTFLWGATSSGNGEFKFTGEFFEIAQSDGNRSDSAQDESQVQAMTDKIDLTIPYSAIKRPTIKQESGSKARSGLCIILGCLPLAIIGSLSNFENGESTATQRGWTMAWLAVGVLCGPATYEIINGFSNPCSPQIGPLNVFKLPVLDLLAILVYGVASLGGMVVVGQMLVDYGSCMRMY